MTTRIEKARHSDALDIARLHAENWQTHYAGILPSDYLANEAVPERVQYWSKALPAGDYSLILVARTAGILTGFVAIKSAVDAGYDATIEHLHVRQQDHSRGLGKQLVSEAARWLSATGAKSVCLWVFEDNKPAIAFYEKLGGVTDAHGTDKFAGGDAPDRRIGWHDLNALQDACNRRARR